VLAHGTGAIHVDACRVAGDKSQRGERLTALGRMNDDGWTPRATQAADTLGRWPSNVVHDGSPEVEAAFAAFGERTSASRKAGVYGVGGSETVYGDRGLAAMPELPADTGTASRFFYSAKATAADRADSKHPTVKPVALMRWLVRLITPPGGAVLDPFAGSGTTGQAAMLEGFNALLIERDATHAADIRHRIKRWSGLDAPLFAEPGAWRP
jgi:site-specific DNA-methyltransferase (adenine-specific)